MIVLDTPPSRNALDFLDAPGRLLGFLEGRALQVFLAPGGPHGAAVRARHRRSCSRSSRASPAWTCSRELSTFFRSMSGVLDGFGERTRASRSCCARRRRRS